MPVWVMVLVGYLALSAVFTVLWAAGMAQAKARAAGGRRDLTGR